MKINSIIVPFEISGKRIEISVPSLEAANFMCANFENIVRHTHLRHVDTGFDLLRSPAYKPYRYNTISEFFSNVEKMNRVNTPIEKLSNAVISKLEDYEYVMSLASQTSGSIKIFPIREIGSESDTFRVDSSAQGEISIHTIPKDDHASFFRQYEEWIEDVISGLASYKGKYCVYSNRLAYLSQGTLSNKEIGLLTGGVTRERIRQEKEFFISLFRQFQLPEAMRMEYAISENFINRVLAVRKNLINKSVEYALEKYGMVDRGRLMFIMACMDLRIEMSDEGEIIVQKDLPVSEKKESASSLVYRA